MKSITIELKGSITIGLGDIKLREGIKDVIEQGYQVILLDFKEVNYLDSSGLGELVAASEYVKENHGKMGIFNVPNKVEKLLYVSLLFDKLNCFDTREAAMQQMLTPQV